MTDLRLLMKSFPNRLMHAITDSIKKEPNRDELYFRRAVLFNKNNFPEPALADFKKAWSLNKQESYALGAGNLLLAKNKDEAIDFLQEALKDLPNSVLLLLSLAHAYDEQNKTDEALNVCNTILQQPSGSCQCIDIKIRTSAKER